jgi:hypothetical protein
MSRIIAEFSLACMPSILYAFGFKRWARANKILGNLSRFRWSFVALQAEHASELHREKLTDKRLSEANLGVQWI